MSAGFFAIKNNAPVLNIVLFTFVQFFQNFGPNTTLFVVAAESFPTKYRATAFSIAAAMGQLGIVLSEIGFVQLKNLSSNKEVCLPIIMGIFCLFLFIGFIFTFLLPETKKKPLEELNEVLNAKTTKTDNSYSTIFNEPRSLSHSSTRHLRDDDLTAVNYPNLSKEKNQPVSLDPIRGQERLPPINFKRQDD
jgi:hypothetical protein